MHPTDFIPSLQELSFFAFYEKTALESGERRLPEILRHMTHHAPAWGESFNVHPEQDASEQLTAFVHAALMSHDEESTLRRCITWLLHPVGAHIMEQIMALDLLDERLILDLMNTDLFTPTMLHSFLETPCVSTDKLDAAHLPLLQLLKTTWGRTQIKKLTWRAVPDSPASNPPELSDLDRWLRPLMDPRLLNARAESGIEQGISLMFYLILGTFTTLPPSLEAQLKQNIKAEAIDEDTWMSIPATPMPRRYGTVQRDRFRLIRVERTPPKIYDYFIRCDECLRGMTHPESDDAWFAYVSDRSLFACAVFGLHAGQSLFSLLMRHGTADPHHQCTSFIPTRQTLFHRWITHQPHLPPHLYGSTPTELIHFLAEPFSHNRLLHDFYSARFSADHYHLLQQVDQHLLRQHLPFFIAHPKLFALHHHHLLRLLPNELIPALMAVHVSYFDAQRFKNIAWIPKKLCQIKASALKSNVGYLLKLDDCYLMHRIAGHSEALSDFWALICQQNTDQADFFNALKTILNSDPRLITGLDRYVKNTKTERIVATLAFDAGNRMTQDAIVSSFKALNTFVEILLAPFVPIIPLAALIKKGPVDSFGFGSGLVHFRDEHDHAAAPILEETVKDMDPQSHERFLSYLPYLCHEISQNKLDRTGRIQPERGQDQLASLSIRLMVHPQLRCGFEHADYQLLRKLTPDSWHRILRNAVAHFFPELFTLDNYHVLRVLHPETVASLFRQLYEHPELEHIFFLDNAYLLRTHAQKIFNTLAKILSTPYAYYFKYFMEKSEHWLSAHDHTLLMPLHEDTLLSKPLLPILLDAWELCPPSVTTKISELLAQVEASTLATLIPSLSHEDQLARLLSLNGHRLYTLLHADVLKMPAMINAFRQLDFYRSFILNDPTTASHLDLRALIRAINPINNSLIFRYTESEKKCLVDLLNHKPSLFLELSPDAQQAFYRTCLDNMTNAAFLEQLWGSPPYLLLHAFQFSWLCFGQIAHIPDTCWQLDDGYLSRQCTAEQWAERLLFSSPAQRTLLLQQHDPKNLISKAQFQQAAKQEDAQWLPLLLDAPSLLDDLGAPFILELLREDACLLERPHHDALLKSREPLYRELLSQTKIDEALNSKLIQKYFLWIPVSVLEQDNHRLMHRLTAQSLDQSLTDLLDPHGNHPIQRVKKLLQVLCLKYEHLLTLSETIPQDPRAVSPLASSTLRQELRPLLGRIFTYLRPDVRHEQSLSTHEVYHTLIQACDRLIPLDPEFWTTQFQHAYDIERLHLNYGANYYTGREQFHFDLLSAADGLLAARISKDLKNVQSFLSMVKKSDARHAVMMKALLTAQEYRLLHRAAQSDQCLECLDVLLTKTHLFDLDILETVLCMDDHRLLKKIAYDPITLDLIGSHPHGAHILNLDGGRLRLTLGNPGNAGGVDGLRSLSFLGSGEAQEASDDKPSEQPSRLQLPHA